MDDVGNELAALIVRVGLADGDAFRTLYQRMSPALYGIALRITCQPAVAAEVVQDTFLQIWRNGARFDPARGSAEVWLASLLRYRAIDAKRRVAREQPDRDMPEIVDEGSGALAALLKRDEARALHACLETLEPSHRLAVSLAFLNGLSHAQLALRLQAPLGTVKSRVRRALSTLRKCLDEAFT